MAIVCVWLPAGVAAAAPTDLSPHATAEALFRDGRRAMQRREFREAAARFGESHRLEPAPGTLLNLALAEAELGLLSKALEHARLATDQLAWNDERHRIATELVAAVDKRLPRLVLRARTPLAPATRVRLDGVELGPGSFDVALPVDPGVHTLEVACPEHFDRRTRIAILEGVTVEQAVEEGDLVGRAPPADAGGPSPRALPVAAPRSGHVQRTLGWAFVGTGGALAATGVVALAFRAANVRDYNSGSCPGVGAAQPSSCEASLSAGRTWLTVSVISFVAGGAFAIGGLALALTAPTRGRGVAAWCSPGSDLSVTCHGTF